MSLARGLYSSTGVLLVPEEQRLNESTISKIKKHHMLSTFTQRLLVYGLTFGQNAKFQAPNSKLHKARKAQWQWGGGVPVCLG